MSALSRKLPEPADPTIEQVLGQFLEASAQRLKPATLRKYENVIELFVASMNNYGPATLDRAETAMFEMLHSAKGRAHREYCQVFGPDKIAGNVDEFLDWFMPRKVLCGKELLKAAGTVTKKLATWLRDEGYLDDEWRDAMAESGAAANKALPAGARLAEALYAHCERHPVEDWTDEREDYFTVEKVEPGKLYLTPVLGDPLGDDDAIVLRLPKTITGCCQTGWQINLALGKTKQGWRILESGDVSAL